VVRRGSLLRGCRGRGGGEGREVGGGGFTMSRELGGGLAGGAGGRRGNRVVTRRGERVET